MLTWRLSAQPVDGAIGASSSNWAYVTSGGGWGARGDQSMLDSLRSASNGGSRIAGIALGADLTNWAYWTSTGGWGARGDQQLLTALQNVVNGGSRIAGIALGYTSTTWAYWTTTGGWGARGDQSLLNSLQSASNSGARIAGISLGSDLTTWAYWTSTGGWGARGDQQLLTALQNASNAGSRIAGISMGWNSTTWAYWTTGGGWGARGDSDLITTLQGISSIQSIDLGRTSNNWMVFYGNGGWSALGETAMLDSLRSASPNATVAPTITTAPQSVSISSGATATFSVSASGTAPFTYQWYRSGTPIPGATSSTYSISTAQAVDAGTYSVTVSNSAGSVSSSSATLSVATNTVVTTGSRIINLSVRTAAGSGAQTLIVGFAVGGAGTSGSKSVLLRAIGPTLTQFSVPNALTDPRLQLFNGSTSIAFNEDWGGSSVLSAAFSQTGAFALPTASRDAAITSTLNNGSYSAQITGPTTGIALAEIYDATPSSGSTTSTPRLVNVSARAQVGTGADILIAGFVISGTGTKNVLIRAIGPSLTQFSVGGALADPQLQLYSGNTQIAANDDWGGGAALSSAFSQVGAFGLTATTKDAALQVALQPGSYSAQVSGVGGTTGIALIEVYELP